MISIEIWKHNNTFVLQITHLGKLQLICTKDARSEKTHPSLFFLMK